MFLELLVFVFDKSLKLTSSLLLFKLVATEPVILEESIDISDIVLIDITNTTPTSKAKRIFAQPTENKGYQFVYLPQSSRTPMNEIRRALSAHDINNARVMDIHFPARNVCGLLVHNDFAPELVSKLNKLGTETLPLFNPNSPDIISDPIHNGKTPEEKADLATKLQKNRAIRIINRSQENVFVVF
ncbi:hypothetical protein MFLAVUS_011481 [Mucor flavus]|uniref:Uncharacterized protein n=1 Tax=Mucor flavus TaxID=439312 RepID=A0ABP9ZFM8_9FUNG